MGQTDRRKQRAVRALMGVGMLRSFAVFIRLQNEQDIWYRAFGSDFGGVATAQGTLQSMANVIGFTLGPLLGGVSDAFGRRPLMILTQMLSFVMGALITLSPTVPLLVLRTLLMPISSEPWEAGYQAALADMFADDAAEYGMATARISTVQSLNMVVGPFFGAMLSRISLRLPWAISTACFCITVPVATMYLPETLPVEARVKFRWKGSNPFSFIKLLLVGPQMRLLALAHVTNALTGRYTTYRYDELHIQRMLGWNLPQRARYASFSALCSIPGSICAGSLLRVAGARSSLFAGQLVAMLEKLGTAAARSGWAFYALRPVGACSSGAELALQYVTSSIGARCGLAQGELQGALGNLRKICGIVAPALWGLIYALGVQHGRPGLFYYCATLAALAQLAIFTCLDVANCDGARLSTQTNSAG